MSLTNSYSVPENRSWESLDFTLSKSVVQEGILDVSTPQPRFGAKGLVILEKDWSVDDKLGEVELTNNIAVSKLFQGLNSSRDVTFNFRLGFADTDVDRTLEEAIKSMYPEEKSDFTLRIKLSPKKNNLTLPIKEDVWITLSCILTLKSLENCEPIYAWTPIQKIDASRELKALAVDLFRNKRYLDAFLIFRQSLTLSCFALEETRKEMSDTDKLFDKEEAEDIKTKCSTNLAACHFLLSNHRQVISLSTELLENDASPKNVKLLYRRGVSNLELQNYEAAIHDLTEASDLDPDNKAIINHLNVARAKQKSANQKLSQGLKKMFA